MLVINDLDENFHLLNQQNQIFEGEKVILNQKKIEENKSMEKNKEKNFEIDMKVIFLFVRETSFGHFDLYHYIIICYYQYDYAIE